MRLTTSTRSNVDIVESTPPAKALTLLERMSRIAGRDSLLDNGSRRSVALGMTRVRATLDVRGRGERREKEEGESDGGE